MTDRDGNLPLHSACEQSAPSAQVISLLVDAFPAGLKVKDKQGNLPLHSAIERGDIVPISVLQTMVSLHPGATKLKDKEGNTALHSACETRTLNLSAIVKMLLDADEELVAPKTPDRDGNLPLHSACEKRDPLMEVITMLVDAFPGALEKKDKQGNLPLHSALERGDIMSTAVIEKMLSAYPEATKVKDRDGNLPLHCAFHCARGKLVENILQLKQTRDEDFEKMKAEFERNHILLQTGKKGRRDTTVV